MPTECFGLRCECYLFGSSNRMFNDGSNPRPSTDLFISLYHVNAVFCLTPTFWSQGYFKQLEIKHVSVFSTHWNSLPILSCMFLHRIIFICVFIFFTIISKFPRLYPGETYFVEAGPRQLPLPLSITSCVSDPVSCFCFSIEFL